MEDEFLALGRQALEAAPFSVLLGTRMLAFTRGQVTMALTLKPQHMQEGGIVHGGVIGYLADNALRFAGGSALGVPVLIAEYKINYVQPAQGAELVAQAHVIATAGQQAVCRCEIRAIEQGAERLVAVAQGTIVGRAAVGV